MNKCRANGGIDDRNARYNTKNGRVYNTEVIYERVMRKAG